jgi:hypothetical protein
MKEIILVGPDLISYILPREPKPGVLVCALLFPATWEAEEGVFLTPKEFKVSLGNLAGSCVKKKKKNKTA